MDKNKHKEMLEEYKQMKTYMGVIQITNKVINRHKRTLQAAALC